MAEWGYRGPKGPQNWADLSKDYATCEEGQQQSPINITGYRTEQLGDVSFSYVTKTHGLRYDGLFVHIDFPTGNTFSTDGQTYQLTSAHFHAPSEHHIEGVSYAAELHLVHSDQQNNLAVVGQLFELGPASSLLQMVLNATSTQHQREADGSGLTTHSFLPRGLSHFRYEGSLTTPPCHEQVKWHVMSQPRPISAEQVNDLLHLSKGPNNRPIQPTEGRRVVQVR